MSEPFVKILFAVLETLLEVFGPELVREHAIRKIDEWEAARAASDAAFRAKFGQDP